MTVVVQPSLRLVDLASLKKDLATGLTAGHDMTVCVFLLGHGGSYFVPPCGLLAAVDMLWCVRWRDLLC